MKGLQNALWELGGVPERHRTDRMTLAVHQDGDREQYTARYQALMRHYGLTAEATNAASGHENGDCEQSHRRFKETVEQALLLRGSRDFASRADYLEFVRSLVSPAESTVERRSIRTKWRRLRALPARRLETLERLRVRVGQGSTIAGEEERVLGAVASDGGDGWRYGWAPRWSRCGMRARGCKRWSGCGVGGSTASTIGT